MTSYLTFIDTFSLSPTASEKIRVKNLKVTLNGGICPFQGQGHRTIFFISEKGLTQMASIDTSCVKIGPAVSTAPSSKCVER